MIKETHTAFRSLTLPKKSMSDTGSERYDLRILKRSPFGGSLVILTPFCRMDTGN
jgi:hypothetical protein